MRKYLNTYVCELTRSIKYDFEARPFYCNIGSKLSPNTSSIFWIQFTVSTSTNSSSSSCNSLMNGSISGSKANHSAPSRSVRARWHCTPESRTIALSERVYLRMAAFISLYWVEESVATANSTNAGITPGWIGMVCAWDSWLSNAAQMGVKWEGER